MYLLLQGIGFLSVLAVFIYKSILQLKLQSSNPPKLIETDFNQNNTKKNSNTSSYILRQKEYETYQEIKYREGIKSAKMSGSALILIDSDLIKAVNQKDFSHFSDRHPPSYHSEPTMNGMLSFATGEDWRKLKAILTQAFSTSRIRRVHQGLNDCAIKLVECIREDLTEGAKEIEIVGPSNKYLLEIIGSSVFGLEETGIFLTKEETPFEVCTKEVQKAMIRHRQARGISGLLKIANLFNLIRPDPKAIKFFKSIIENSIQTRKERGERGDDLLQLLMEATADSKGNQGGLTEEMILSQALMFFFAGTEGPATLLIYGLYELAMNPEIQEKLYKEVAAIMELDASPNHETLMKLPYLDMFVCEVLRMYSSSVTARRCASTYKVPGTNIVVKPGTSVHTPIYGIHHDEEFYPNPFKFNPDNFSEEAKARRPQTAYIPFGIGPRSCIAQKFGLVQGKSVLCHLIYNFKFESCRRTESPPKGSIQSMYLPENGLWLQFEDRLR